MHLRENYADDDTYLRWVNSNLLFMHSLELLVTIALATQVEEMLSQAAGLGLSAEPKVAFIGRWGGVDLDRPGLTELRRQVEAGEVRVVVAYSPAVLAEKPLHQMTLANEFQRAGALLHFVHGKLTDVPGADVTPHSPEVLARLEGSHIADRMMGGRMRVAPSGRQPDGALLLGYDCAPQAKERLLNDVEATAVRLVFQRAAEGWTPHRLAKWLNGEGYCTKRGRSWTPTGVRRLLANRGYKGIQFYGLKGERNGLAGHSPEVIRMEGFSPPIVSIEQFERVQGLTDERQAKLTKSEHLAGLDKGGRRAVMKVFDVKVKVSHEEVFVRLTVGPKL